MEGIGNNMERLIREGEEQRARKEKEIE